MSAASDNPREIGLAIVCNSLPPYRVHLHQRVARELDRVKLWTLCTHEGEDARWGYQPPAEINPVSFRSGPGKPDRHGVSLASFSKGGEVISWMRQNAIKAVVVMGYNDPCRARIIRWAHRHGVACFMFGDSNIRGDTATGLRFLLKRMLVGWVIRHCAAVFPCGSMGRAYFLKYGASPDRIFYFPYEPDYSEIHGVSAARVDEVIRQFGMARERRRIVFSGRLIDAKRPDLLIRSFVSIAPQRPQWDLVMVGDGAMRAELEQLVPPGLKSRVFWTGFISEQATVSALYRGSDVLVLPSRYEPWALVVNEAAAAGMALVCSDVVGAAIELVRDGVNGRLFPEGDQQAATECLLDVTAPERIDAMKAASPMVLEEWRRVADPVNGLRQALRMVGLLS
jgi:glycosyltransferase involved in cell wall biosynthesis